MKKFESFKKIQHPNKLKSLKVGNVRIKFKCLLATISLKRLNFELCKSNLEKKSIFVYFIFSVLSLSLPDRLKRVSLTISSLSVLLSSSPLPI